jgi:hypothetical protein
VSYRYVQYIFYPSGTAFPLQPYGLGAPYTLLDEALYRAMHMVKVLRYARDQLADLRRRNRLTGQVESEILKIFMAPEFYFRSADGKLDGTGHYSLFEVQSARHFIRDAVLSDKTFDDWFIVPGTAIYCQQRANRFKTPVIFNEAWAVARATDTNPKVEVTCQKQYFSSTDDLDETKAAMFPGSALAKLVRYVDRQIVRVGGVDIGFEICLDHRSKALKNTVTARRPVNPRNVDVHLLPSCGMETIADSVAARSNGYFLRCNGNDHALPRYEAFQVGAWPATGRPNINSVPPLYDLAAQLTSQALPPPLQIYGPSETDEIGFSGVLPL